MEAPLAADAIAVFGGCFALAFAWEMRGVLFKRERGDTITDIVHYFRDRLSPGGKVAFRTALVASALWAVWHLGWEA